MFSYFSEYPTFLVFLGAVFGMVLTMAFMPAFIRFLKRKNL